MLVRQLRARRLYADLTWSSATRALRSTATVDDRYSRSGREPRTNRGEEISASGAWGSLTRCSHWASWRCSFGLSTDSFFAGMALASPTSRMVRLTAWAKAMACFRLSGVRTRNADSEFAEALVEFDTPLESARAPQPIASPVVVASTPSVAMRRVIGLGARFGARLEAPASRS